MPLPKYVVRLTAEERAELDDLIRTGKRAASVLIHARILAEALECGASRGTECAKRSWREASRRRCSARSPRAGSLASGMAPRGIPDRAACGAPPLKGAVAGPCGYWPTDGSSWTWWSRSARNACA
ncbi:MAG: hypothetical protein IPL59_26685 [Candidatus Competibacteraceae bacterium]|nr:hypothetical protein [Candidatus Competibacteraceae bacterium]